VLDNNKAWRAAETVRREWLKSFVAASRTEGALRFISSKVPEGDHQLMTAWTSNTTSHVGCLASTHRYHVGNERLALMH
jgi:hypothetical protein